MDISDFSAILDHQNRWKSSPQLLATLACSHERYLARILADEMLAENWKHHAVSGPRRTGKSVILYQTIRKLLDHGIPDSRIFHLDLDNRALASVSLQDAAEMLLQICADASNENPVFLIADEIARKPEWEMDAKSMHDLKLPVRLLASSSARSHLLAGCLETGVGRWTVHELLPLNFYEYVTWALGEGSLPSSYHAGYPSLSDRLHAADTLPHNTLVSLNRLLDQYLLIGGYPLPSYRQEPPRLLSEISEVSEHQLLEEAYATLQDIADRAVLNISAENKIRSTDAMNAVTGSAATMTAKEMTYEKMAEHVAHSPITVRSHLRHLEDNHIAFQLRNLSSSHYGESRRAQKIYWVDGALANQIRQQGTNMFLDSQMKGEYLENVIASHLFGLCVQGQGTLNYWRRNSGTLEVDFVYRQGSQPAMAIESASSRSHHLKGLKKAKEKIPDLEGGCWLAAPNAVFTKPTADPQGVGKIPTAMLLLAAGAQAVQFALSKGTTGKVSNYQITARATNIPPYGNLAEGDQVLLTQQEAMPHQAKGEISHC